MDSLLDRKSEIHFCRKDSSSELDSRFSEAMAVAGEWLADSKCRRVSDVAERGELMNVQRGLLMLGITAAVELIYKDMMIVGSWTRGMI